MEHNYDSKKIIICCCIAFILFFFILIGAGQCKQPDKGSSKRAKEFSGERETVTSTIINVSERLGELGEVQRAGFTELKTGLRQFITIFGQNADTNEQRAERLDKIADQVEDMENRIGYLDQCWSDFFDWYYDTLDAQIEEELGIKIPR